jgi:heat shock protein HslJ
MQRIAAVLAVAVVLAACGGGEVTGPGEAPAGLDGTEWVLVAGVPMVDGYPITLRVEDGRVGGIAACNSYGGDVVVSGDRLEVTDVARTEMGCPEPGVHDSESAFLDALLAVDRYERTQAQLVLLGPGVELRFDPVAPEPDAALTGTPWRLESLLSGAGPDGTASSTMADATLRLDDDGTFHASDGCNDLDGRWVLEGDTLRLLEVITTDMACPGIDQQVEHVHEVLLGEPTVTLEGRRLVLAVPERALDYRAA